MFIECISQERFIILPEKNEIHVGIYRPIYSAVKDVEPKVPTSWGSPKFPTIFRLLSDKQ